MTKIVTKAKLSGNRGETKAAMFFTQNNFLVRSQFQNDFGIDMEIELLIEKDKEIHASGQIAKIQIKNNVKESTSFSISENEEKYLRQFASLPIFFILITDNNTFYIFRYTKELRRNINTKAAFKNLFTKNKKDNNIFISDFFINKIKSDIKKHYLNFTSENTLDFLRIVHKHLVDEEDLATFSIVKDAFITSLAHKLGISTEEVKKAIISLNPQNKAIIKLIKS